jgi:hypothetical protein
LRKTPFLPHNKQCAIADCLLFLCSKVYTFTKTVKINLIYEKHIHHLMEYVSVWYGILEIVEILVFILLRYLSKSRGKKRGYDISDSPPDYA